MTALDRLVEAVERMPHCGCHGAMPRDCRICVALRGALSDLRKERREAKRLVYGRDWHGWAWRHNDGPWCRGNSDAAVATRDAPVHPACINGAWVRVKFVEAKHGR